MEGAQHHSTRSEILLDDESLLELSNDFIFNASNEFLCTDYKDSIVGRMQSCEEYAGEAMCEHHERMLKVSIDCYSGFSLEIESEVSNMSSYEFEFRNSNFLRYSK